MKKKHQLFKGIFILIGLNANYPALLIINNKSI